MRRKLLVTALLLVAGGLLWVYTSATHVLWGGRFDLTVRVSSTPGPPRAVSCEAFGRREHAEFALEHLLPPETRTWSAVADPFAGEPLTVGVRVSGRQSMSGRQLRRTQDEYLVVVAVLPDGRRVGKLVAIPDGRACHEVGVELP